MARFPRPNDDERTLFGALQASPRAPRAAEEDMISLAVRLARGVEDVGAKATELVAAAKLAADLDLRQREQKLLADLEAVSPAAGARSQAFAALEAGAEPEDVALVFGLSCERIEEMSVAANAFARVRTLLLLRLRFLYGEGTAAIAANKTGSEVSAESQGASEPIETMLVVTADDVARLRGAP